MGDSIDNVKGVPGIGEKGARDLIAQYGSLDSLLAHAGEIKQKKYREGLLAHADQARQSRELVTIRTDVRRAVRDRAIPVQGRRSRALLRAVLEDGVPHAGPRVRADGLVGRQGLCADRIGRGPEGARRGDEGGRAIQHEGDHRRHRAGARDAGRHRRLDARLEGALHPARARRLRRRLLDAEVRGARAAGAAAHRSVDRKDRPRPEGRSDRARPPRRRRAEPEGLRHDDRELPGRCEPLEPGARADRARAARLQGGHRGRGARQGRQGDRVRAGAGRQRARLRRRARRPRAAAVRARQAGAHQRRARVRLSRSRAAARADPRRDRAHRRARRRALARIAGGGARSRDERLEPADLHAWPAASSTSARRSSSPRSCSRSCSCRC